MGDPAARAARVTAWLEYPRAWEPSVASDGATVYAISDRGGLPQAWKAPTAGGPLEPFLPRSERVMSVQPNPERPLVVAVTDRGGDENWHLDVVDTHGQLVRELSSDPTRIHEPGGWRDGHRYVFRSNARDPRFFDLYEVDIDRPEPPRRVREEDGVHEIAATRSERVVLLRSVTNLDIDLIAWSEAGERLLNPRSAEETVASATLTSDRVYAASNPGREYRAVVRYDPGGSAPEILWEPPGDVDLVRASPSGDRLAVVANDRGWSRLVVLDLPSGTPHPVALPSEGVIDRVDWRPDSRGLVFDLGSMELGTEVFHLDVPSGGVRALTTAGRPLPAAPPTPVLREFRAEDGLRVPYWEYLPSGAPRATIVDVHGGPEAQARPQYLPLVGFLVHEGYRVLYPNVRGSAGYGRTYVHLDDVDRRMDSVRDLRDLVRASGADSGPVAVMGGSYGGFMVLAAVTTYPELWAAGIDVVGIANFVTFLERTAPWRRPIREPEYGRLDRDRALLERISPIHHVDRIRTPMFIVHGANDPRVPVGEAEQIVAALRERRVPVEYLRFEDEGHGLVRQANQIAAIVRAVEFLERHVGPSAPP